MTTPDTIELRRSDHDRRLYELAGHGTLRLLSRARQNLWEGTTTEGRAARFVVVWRPLTSRWQLQAVGGSVITEVERPRRGAGGAFLLDGHRYVIERRTAGGPLFFVRDGVDAALLRGRAIGKALANVQVLQATDSMALLFACWIARLEANESASASGGGASAAAAGAS